MDCEGASRVLLHRELRTLSSAEEADLHAHLDGCEACRAQAEHTREDRKGEPTPVEATAGVTWRPVVQLPANAVDAGVRAMLPAIDPVVFDIDLEIAAGGMGRISKAHDRRLGREVAIKEVLEPRMRARFEREAMITARLQHPAIVPVYEAGTFPSGNPFYTMRLVWGGTLGGAFEKAKSMQERLTLLPHVIAVTDALAYAHSHRIIHRDLKPGNVLVGEFGETVVIDWGLAKELGEDTDVEIPIGAQTTVVSSPNLTRAGAVLGTPGFMSPEQANGDAIDERGDVYALGAILYNLLAGDPPYYDRGGTDGATQIIAAALQGPPRPIAELAPNAPADLRAIVEKAMARDRADRYPTAKEMAEELRRFAAGQLIAREYTLRELAGRWIAKHRTAVVVGAIAAVALAVIAVFAFVNVSRSRRDEAAAARAAEDARKVAERERDNARRDAAALQEEQGLRELGQGDSSRALAYLAAAYQEKRTANTGLHYLLTVASQDLALPAQVIAQPGKAIAFAGGKLAMVGQRSITLGAAEESFGQEVFAGKSFFDPTGQSVAIELTRGREQRIEMWDVVAEKPRWRHTSIATGTVVFDAGGKRAAIYHRDGIALHDVADGREVAQFRAPANIESVALDTEHVVACGADGIVRVWFLRDTRREPQRLGSGCKLVALLDMGRLVYANASFELVRWTINKDAHDDIMSGHLAIKAIAVNKPKTLIAMGDATGVVLWDWKGNALGESREVQGGIDKLAFSEDGSFLVGAGSDDRVFVWDTPSFHLRQAFGGGRGRIEAIAIDPDQGKRIAVLTAEQAQVWATPVGRLRRYVPGTGFAVAGTQLVAQHDDGITLHSLVADRRSDLAEGSIDAMYGNDKLIVLVGTYGGVMGFDPARGTPVGKPRVIDPTRISEDAPHLLVEYEAHHAVVRSTESHDELARVSLPEPPRGFAISPDGKLLALLYTRSIEQWRIDSSERLSVDELPDKHAYTARYAASGNRLVLFSHRGAVVLEAGKQHELYTGAVQHAAISADGNRVALGVDNTVQLWDAVAGHKKPLYPPISATIPKSFALDGTGDLLATGSVDGQVRIWDHQGRLLDRLVASQSGITRLAFAVSDTRLVALSKDNTIAVWDVHIDRRPWSAIAALVADRGSWELVDGKLSLRRR